ncbi:hypothetical protein OKA06_02290 [Novosphingobium sp. MW5]|nr:hypothetical protein [Novosphingobium sp. MW5]
MSGGGSRAVTILARVSLGFFALLGVGHIAMLAMRPEVRGMGPDACDRSQSESGKIISDLTRSVLGDAPVFDDWTGLCAYAAANAALLKSGQPVEMVFIGDLLTQQWGDVDPALFGNARPNRGISGQSSVEVLARVPSDVVALRPRVMHVLAGTNDVLGVRGPSTPRAGKARCGRSSILRGPRASP